MAAGLAPMVKFTVPFPVPLPGVTLVIQLAPLVAVQAHPGVVVTAIGVPGPPAAAADWEVGLMEYEQLGFPGGGPLSGVPLSDGGRLTGNRQRASPWSGRRHWPRP